MSLNLRPSECEAKAVTDDDVLVAVPVPFSSITFGDDDSVERQIPLTVQ